MLPAKNQTVPKSTVKSKTMTGLVTSSPIMQTTKHDLQENDLKDFSLAPRPPSFRNRVALSDGGGSPISTTKRAGSDQGSSKSLKLELSPSKHTVNPSILSQSSPISTTATYSQSFSFSPSLTTQHISPMSGARSSPLRKSSGSFTSLSPLSSPSAKRAAPFPLDQNEQIQILRVDYKPYDPYDSEDDEASSFVSLHLENLISTGHTKQQDANADLIAKLQDDFLDRMYVGSKESNTLISFRLQSGRNKPSRRTSYCIDGKVIACPKKPPISTKTNNYYSIAAGHIPRELEFLNAAYNFLDNKIPGDFCQEIKNIPCDFVLLDKYRKTISADIQEVKMFSNLVCFSERVPVYNKSGSADPELQYTRSEGQTVLKHFIQETRSLSAILELIEMEICEFMESVDGKIYFRERSNERNNATCLIDLKMISTKFEYLFDPISIKSFADFKKYIESISSSDPDAEQNSLFHTPIFYIKNNNILPLMVHAGDNGYHVTGDADPQHIGVRADMPRIVFKTFNGAKDNPNNFVIGLEILIARLECSTKKEFHDYLKSLKESTLILKNLTILDNFADEFDHTTSLYYDDYTNIDYYNNYFITQAKNTLKYYRRNPKLISTVGESSLNDLIRHVAFDHPLYVHGTESSHPKSQPEPFSAIISCNDGKFAITGNEKSYIAYLLHEHKILHDQRIGVHPYWLGDTTSGALYAESWLDILSIQALHEASKGNNDPKRSAYEFSMYQCTLISSMTKGRNTEKLAFDKINVRFKHLEVLLHKTNYSTEEINKHINDYYAKYSIEISAVRNVLHLHAHSIFSSQTSFSQSTSARTLNTQESSSHLFSFSPQTTPRPSLVLETASRSSEAASASLQPKF